MKTIHILPAYAATLSLVFIFLSIRTLSLRRRLKIQIGDAGDPQMLRAMRVHSNFAEYVPLGLVLLLLIEMLGLHPLWVHGLALCLLVGRMSHAYGLSQSRENFKFRIVGMVLTFTCLAGCALALFLSYL